MEIFTSALLGIAAGSALFGATDESAKRPVPTTYCNPLPLPNYPLGGAARGIANGEPRGEAHGWLLERKEQFRELADPAALWHEGKWYLYPSCDMAWVSADEGLTWQHQPLNPRDLGYAPTIVRHAGRFLLMASQSELYASTSPLGPFEKLGRIEIPQADQLPRQVDPMLFSDEDGRLYYYWGCSPRDGIWAVELDAKDPLRVVGEPAQMIPFRPEEHPWERLGNWNQNPNLGWLEGGWILKRNGRYYLTYSAGGTEYRAYAMGCYVGDSPLGPFKPQRRNPILRTPAGLITGTAHGCVVAGPRDQLWVFYTLVAGVAHGFERRVGFDLARLDEAGELYVPAATSRPQRLRTADAARDTSVDPGWLPLNDGELTIGSSNAANLPGRFAVDQSLTTWWQPASDDARPTLTTKFNGRAMIHSVRLVWRDVGLDTAQGVRAGPIRYRIEAENRPNEWTTIVDRSESTDDLLVDYRECPPTAATRARLTILASPTGITPGVVEFTVFGITTMAEP